MRYDSIKFLAERNFYQYNGVRLHLGVKHEDGRFSVAKPPEFESLPQGHYAPDYLTIDDTAAQALMDSLYDCGYRPTRGKESEGQIEAIKYHLEDMRLLALKGKR
jgi:hypothetical protein